PAGCASLLRGLLGVLGLGVAALETLRAPARVHQLLLAGVGGVAGRADVRADLAHRRAGLERVAARAVDVRDLVIGVDALLHGGSISFVASDASSPTLPYSRILADRLSPRSAPSRCPSGRARSTWSTGACRSAARAPRQSPARAGPGGDG